MATGVVTGYFVEVGGEPTAADVFVALNEEQRNGRVPIYSPIGQHSQADKEYIAECTKITKEQYKEISKGYYTPEDYV